MSPSSSLDADLIADLATQAGTECGCPDGPCELSAAVFVGDGVVDVRDLGVAARCDVTAAALLRFAAAPSGYSARMFGRAVQVDTELGSAVFMVSVMLARRGRAVPDLDLDALMDQVERRAPV